MPELNLAWIANWTKLEYDGLHFTDDWGEQARLMIKSYTWRQIIKPKYAKKFALQACMFGTIRMDKSMRYFRI